MVSGDLTRALSSDDSALAASCSTDGNRSSKLLEWSDEGDNAGESDLFISAGTGSEMVFELFCRPISEILGGAKESPKPESALASGGAGDVVRAFASDSAVDGANRVPPNPASNPLGTCMPFSKAGVMRPSAGEKASPKSIANFLMSPTRSVREEEGLAGVDASPPVT